MAAFFVTATGTGIGKTFVTAGLIRLLRARGEAAFALKPVVSGISNGNLAESDPGVLLDAMGIAVSPEAIAGISPWRFAAPLSPDMAAAREDRSVPFDELVEFCRSKIAATRGTLFIEGVGGVLVPLDARHTVRDWMKALDLPVILVAGSYLGTISHTLTALEALRHRGLNVALLAIDETENAAVPLEQTIKSLGRFAGHVPIASLRRDERRSHSARDFERLWESLCRADR